ncbi:hypothetical protein Cni_G01071 [Canna indica]|uniref:DUF4283 domain-containing protein n=1 Tax=Canna indica TaxID=4628 RepID=A0AAQ3Q0J5_9LILI|nr:hypothetical protein Cni_G01071 [Canna indica]
MISEEDIEKTRRECKLVLYGKFFGRTPSLELVKNIMHKLWKIKGSCKVIDLASDFFAFKFNDENDYWSVYSGGPWFLRGQVLSLVQWKKNFQPMKEEVSVVPVWIQMPSLLLEFMSQDILLQLAAVIGKSVKIDEYTKAGDRGKFTRILAYENLMNICYNCEKNGHKEEVRNSKERKETNAHGDEHKKKDNKEERLLGPWVQVLKKNRKGFKRDGRMESTHKKSFTVLDNPTFEDAVNRNEGTDIIVRNNARIKAESEKDRTWALKKIMIITEGMAENEEKKENGNCRWRRDSQYGD